MGCGCRKNRTSGSSQPQTLMLGGYQVWKNDQFTGRSFVSLAMAQKYAERISGEVRETSE